MPGIGTTHHVQIGDYFFLLRQATYRKRPAPLFGPRFTTGDPNYNNLSQWQYWAQTCWVGGFGAETWRDDAMFDEGVGVDATQHEVMTLSRDLGPSTRGTWVLSGNTGQPYIFAVYNNTLYCLATHISASDLWRYNDGSPGTWTKIKDFTEAVAWMDSFNGYLVFGDAGTTLNRMDSSETFTTFAKPSGRTEKAYMMKTYRDHCYFVFGKYVYRLKKDFTWDGSTHFYEASDINYINHMEVHLGFLYMSSRNGHILRTDGNNTFDLWQFDNHVVIWGLRSFDGRLFIGAAEEIEGTDSAQAVLYQFSGAAVTELKRWGRVGQDSTPGKLRAFERKLFFGASNLLGMGDEEGFGIAAYDPVEDAFHMFASNRDSVAYTPGTEGVNNRVDDVMFFKGRLFCATRGWGVFATPWTYKDVTRTQGLYDNTPIGSTAANARNGGWYESSDFDAGTPGLLKLWNAITLHIDLPTTACSASVEASVDGGNTWFFVGDVYKEDADIRYATELPLGSYDGTPGSTLNTDGGFETFSGTPGAAIANDAALQAVLDGWDDIRSLPSGSEVRVENTDPDTGTYCLALEQAASPTAGAQVMVESARFAVTGGQMYEIKARTRGQSGNSAGAAGGVGVRWFTAGGAEISGVYNRTVVGANTSWRDTSFHRVAPENAVEALIGVRNTAETGYSAGNDTVLFDNVDMHSIDGEPLRGTRLKYRVTLRTTDTSRSPQLRGVIVRYLPIPEPNWVWEMTAVLSDKQELLDLTIEEPDNETKVAALRAAFRAQNLVYYRDVNGEEYMEGGRPGVRIDNMEELLPHLGPSSAGALEYEVRLTLIEAVDSYEEPATDPGV